MKPGELLLGEGTIALNVGRPTVEIDVENHSHHTVFISSHFPFFEVNRRLVFDRARAWGMHLDLPAGDAACWRPGETKRVQLVPYAGGPAQAMNDVMSGLVPMVGITSGRCFAGNAAILGCCDVVIATDFGHGLIGPRIVRQLTDLSPFLAVNTQSNSANLGYNLITRYPRADYICIDGPEARLALGFSGCEAVQPIARAALRAAMIPTVNGMMTVGLVQLPGMMTGQILAGSSPLLAIKYQLVVVFMQAAATALASLLFVRLAAGRYLTPAHQLYRHLL